jgi:phosphatidylinositol alpha 1,6-mannosyltransferase
VIPRVAFFTDSFHEVNGVALTSRQFHEFAHRRGYPFLSVHFGPAVAVKQSGDCRTVELKRGSINLAVERDLAFDLLFARYKRMLLEEMRAFRPDLVHATGAGDTGLLAAWLARNLNVPLVLSWHTNLHEYAERRVRKMLRKFPARIRNRAAAWSETNSMNAVCRFYKLGKLLFAPNPELCEMLRERTGKPVYTMVRGSDVDLFNPRRRSRALSNGQVQLGFVGRLSPEKNVRMLARLGDDLERTNPGKFGFVVVGDGVERQWLETHLKRARFTGILKGEPLAKAYADMDLFLFPSETDTYGNVVVEAMASGVPVVVTAAGGPKFLVRSGENGYVAVDEKAFIESVRQLLSDDATRWKMGAAARSFAETLSWDRVFEGVYAAYQKELGKGVAFEIRPSAAGSVVE